MKTKDCHGIWIHLPTTKAKVTTDTSAGSPPPLIVLRPASVRFDHGEGKY